MSPAFLWLLKLAPHTAYFRASFVKDMANRTQFILVGVSAAGVAGVIGVYLWRKWSSSSRRKVAEVTQLYVYPIKSCHRIELKESDCNKRGLKYDR